MKSPLLSFGLFRRPGLSMLGAAAVLAQTFSLHAQEKAPSGAPAAPAASAPASAPAPDKTEELEAAFVETLSGVLFKGRWCTVEKGVMGFDRDEQYEIVGVMKTGGDRWAINARIQYGKVNLVVPVPVQVKWAGETPVIIVDKFTMPGAGTYSARVMIFEGTYSGTWTAKDHGGLLHGLITKKPAAEPAPEAAPEKKE